MKPADGIFDDIFDLEIDRLKPALQQSIMPADRYMKMATVLNPVVSPAPIEALVRILRRTEQMQESIGRKDDAIVECSESYEYVLKTLGKIIAARGMNAVSRGAMIVFQHTERPEAGIVLKAALGSLVVDLVSLLEYDLITPPRKAVQDELIRLYIEQLPSMARNATCLARSLDMDVDALLDPTPEDDALVAFYRTVTPLSHLSGLDA